MALGDVSAAVRRDLELWCGCIAGAREEPEYVAKLRAAGFERVQVEPWRLYAGDEVRALPTARGVDVEPLARQVDGAFASAFVRATKPATPSACCGPTCCTQ